MSQCLFISPSKIEAMISGAVRCIKNARHVTLVYVDSTEETVKTCDMEAVSPPVDWNNWFCIVGSVQSLRKPLIHK